MKLSKKSGGDFTPHDEGTFRAVCVDVTPLVKRETKFGIKEEFRFVFETDGEAREDGTPPCVWSRGFTPSLNEKAALRKFLRQWFGRDLSPAEESELDTEDLIGKGANLVIVHEQSQDGDKTYANIVACTPCKGEVLEASGKFVRKKDREEKEAKGDEASYRNAAKPEKVAKKPDAVDATIAGADWTKVKVHVGKHSGVELRDLDPEAIEKLSSNWLPKHEANPNATADDKRLAAALKLAKEELAGATQEEY